MVYTCVKVHILDMPFKADRAYEYILPFSLAELVKIGSFVTVPFGNGNRRQTGIVTDLFEADKVASKTPSAAEFMSRLSKSRGVEPYDGDEQAKKRAKTVRKPVLAVLPDVCSVSQEMVELCAFMKETTLCTIGDAVRAIMPSGLLSYAELFYSIGENVPDPTANDTDGWITDLISVYSFIKSNEGAFIGSLRLKFGERIFSVLERMEAEGYVKVDAEIRGATAKTVKYVKLTLSDEDLLKLREGSLSLRSPKQRRFLEILDANGGYMKLSDMIASGEGLGRTQATSLEGHGMVKLEDVEVRRSPSINVNRAEPPKYTLNDEQMAALDKISELASDGAPHGALLLGVTGSGKTAVMIKAIDRVIETGRGVIVLLPEIALTPQMMGIFCSYYGEKVAVMHSGLSAGERLDTYNYVREGKADIVIGTRSAVFAPVKDLGMIIIDEEQEHTYKSDVSPKYHARDIARFRCAKNNALMLLCSATPSVESYAKAKEGKYHLITLNGRYGGAELPEVDIYDMRVESAKGNITPLGVNLVNALCEVYEKGEQSILFINRRGYHNFMSCKTCGEAILCPSCSVSMTYHKDLHGGGYLFCHWCGHKQPVPNECPSCHSTLLGFAGYGTQHIEEDLGKLIPGARVLRMDTDTTGTKQAYDDILGSFRRHEADILLGTQMVTKGHDFPDVTLVGVLLADMSLYVDDYRAAERTFSMLTQVIGRAGRGRKKGRAIIQTNNPDNDVIRLAKAQDYPTFADNELRLRRSLVFPPYCDIVLFTIAGSDEKAVADHVSKVHKSLSELLNGEFSDVKNVVFGPFEAPVYRVEKKYRMRIVMKCRINKRSRALITALLERHSGVMRAPSLSVDINPSSL